MLDRWMGGRLSCYMDVGQAGWVAGSLAGYIGEWIDGWIAAWMDGQLSVLAG